MYLNSHYKNQCCGCGACMNICPKHAIKMKEDYMGFKYPIIDSESCVNCHKCENICSFDINHNSKDDYVTTAYGARHRDESIRKNSRSGGIFTAISDIILKNHGSVYGCILDETFNAIHIKATDKTTRDMFRGSKYIQSDISDVYDEIIMDLKSGKQVMFSGTTCQVAAIKKYMELVKIPTDNLYLIDIVCHGVPSSVVFQDYINYIEKRYDCRILNINFRNKTKYGWKAHVETFLTDNGEIDTVFFRKLFYGHNILRDSCFECPYKNTVRSGDLSLADFWGVDREAPELDDNKGISLVLLHTDKGEQLFQKCIDTMIFKKVEVKNCLQPPLKAPFPMPASRDLFWKKYKKGGIKWAIRNLYVERFLYVVSVLIERIKKKRRHFL